MTDERVIDQITATMAANMVSLVDAFSTLLPSNQVKRRILRKATKIAVAALDRREGA